MTNKAPNNALDDWFPSQKVGKSENLSDSKPIPSKPKVVKSESRKADKKESLPLDVSVMRSKTFDLPINLITYIKVEAASKGKKEYQIALEAFEQYFHKKF
jgi:hypothetical protein